MHKPNIKLAYVLTFLSEFYLPSTAFLFFYLRYFSFAQIATLTAVQMLTANILEIPTGAFADLVGRKKSILLSFVVASVALLLFPFATSFYVFVLLEMAKGLANALYSGSMEAFVYDDLKQNGDSKHYPKVSSNIETVTWTAWFLSSIAGGYLYFWNFRSPWIITGLLFVAGAIMATRLVEPKIDSIKVHLKAAIRQNLAGFRELFRTPKIRNITLQLAIVGAGYIIASGILGNSQAREYGMDARGVGWLFGIGCLASVVASRYFTKLKEMLGEQKLIALTTTALLASFLVARYVGVVAGSLLIIMRIASSSTFRNTRSVIVNEWISSKNRATALSTLSLISQTPYIFLAPLFGVMIDQSSPNNFAFMIGVAIIVGIIGMQINSKLYVRRK